MNRARLARRLAYGLAALLVAVAALLALADWLIDTPAVKAAIEKRLSSALGGQIAWEGLDLHVLPAPHGELRRVRVEIPGAVSARAEQVKAYLRLWPLLRGHPEIASLSVARPEVRIAAWGGASGGGEAIEPLAAYRQAIEPVAQALQKFAPDTEFSIEAAAIEAAGMPFQLRELNAKARTDREGLDLAIDTAGNLWKHLRIDAHIAYADLSARGSLEVDELALHKDLPAATLRAQLRTDAKTAIECDLEASLGALLPEARAKLTLSASGKPPEVDARLSRIDLAQALALARRNLAGLEAIESAEGRLSANVRLSLGAQWRAHVEIFESSASAKLVALPWKLSAHAARITATERELRISDLRGTLGESGFSDVAAAFILGEPLRLSAASGRATLRLEQWFPWLRRQLPLEEIAEISGGAEVALNRLALRFDRPAAADYDATITLRQVSASLKPLPAPVSADGGAVRVDPASVRFEKVAVAMLDARTVVSGTFGIKGSRLELGLADGTLGEKAVQWGLARAEVPARFEPRTPLRFAARRIAWAPGAPLEADASIDFEGGPNLAAALAWQPEKLNLRRLAIKDARSNAVLGASIVEGAVQASFSGSLQGSSIAAMLRHPLEADSGSARGDARVTIDRAHPERTIGEGKLTIEALDLSWLAGRKARVARADISAEPTTGLRIASAEVEWEQQKFALRGQIRHTAQGPVIDAQLESPGVVVERLLPAEKKPETPAGRSKLWPLPVTGKVELQAGFVQYQHYKIAPFEGSLVLERSRAALLVKEARMCGVSFPLSAEAAPEAFSVAAQIAMRDQPLQATMHCLTGDSLDITGNADLSADLRTHGKGEEELIRNLSGSARTELRKGRVKKFALIGNILSIRNIASLKQMEQEGFPYRSMSASGRFENGAFLLEEGFFDSDAARLAAHGSVDLLGANSHLDVLVGLLTTVDRVAGAIPILGDVFGGSMLALPVSVNGDIRDPRVVPLGPRAVTDRLLGIFERTLKLPGKLVAPPVEEPAPPPR